MSSGSPHQLDVTLAHQYFSAECFNRTWTLIETRDRPEAQAEDMVLTALASLWHWTQRADCTDQNRSIGHWQVSRVYALVGQGDNALRHARRALALAEGLSPFYVGYAHEAIARAALLQHDRQLFAAHWREARRCADEVVDTQEFEWLDQDL